MQLYEVVDHIALQFASVPVARPPVRVRGKGCAAIEALVVRRRGLSHPSLDAPGDPLDVVKQFAVAPVPPYPLRPAPEAGDRFRLLDDLIDGYGPLPAHGCGKRAFTARCVPEIDPAALIVPVSALVDRRQFRKYEVRLAPIERPFPLQGIHADRIGRASILCPRRG